VADDRFDGSFSVTTIELDGQSEPPVEPMVVEIDATFGDLTIDTTCGSLLGSFSFFDDGRAGITIAGRSNETCSDEAEAQIERLLTVLGRVTRWTADENMVELVGPSGEGISLLG
jgi:hypothetical protein